MIDAWRASGAETGQRLDNSVLAAEHIQGRKSTTEGQLQHLYGDPCATEAELDSLCLCEDPPLGIATSAEMVVFGQEGVCVKTRTVYRFKVWCLGFGVLGFRV